MVEIFVQADKVSNTFHTLFSNNMQLFRTGIHKMDMRIAIRENPDQIDSSFLLGLPCLTSLVWQAGN